MPDRLCFQTGIVRREVELKIAIVFSRSTFKAFIRTT